MNLFTSFKSLLGPSQVRSPQIRNAVEAAGELVGPMLKAAPGYPQRLAEPAAYALDYCSRLARSVPGPLDVGRQAFATIPLVHALFGRFGDINEMLGRSHVLRDFLQKNVISSSFCALLGTRRKEKRQFGMALEHGLVVRDAPQTTLYFSDHTLTDPAADVDEARAKLQASMFRGLLESYALHVREILDEQERTKLDMAMEKASARLHHTAAPEIPHAGHSRRLQELDAALRAHAEDLSPRGLLEQLAACFRAPESFLRLDPVEVSVDRMGVVVEDAAARDLADRLRFVELTSRDRRQWVVMLARIDRDEAQAAIREVERATRYIII